jgi:hypothetical protein
VRTISEAVDSFYPVSDQACKKTTTIGGAFAMG